MKRKRSMHAITGALIALTLLLTGCNDNYVPATKSDSFVDDYQEAIYMPGTEHRILQDPFTSSYYCVGLKSRDNGGGSSFQKNAADKFPEYAEGDNAHSVTQNLKLPAKYKGLRIRWCSSDETLLETDGTVHRPHDESKYVVLSGEYSEGKSVYVRRYILRIERDMYANKNFEDVFPVEYYDNQAYLEENQIDLSDVDGWCYLLDDWEQLYTFEEDEEHLKVWIDNNPDEDMFEASGNLCDMRIESRHEAELLIYALKKLIKTDISEGSLQYDGGFVSDSLVRYHFQQYYQGVKVYGGTVTLHAFYDQNKKIIKSSLVPMPEGFNVTPKISAKKIKGAKLVSDQIDGEQKLVFAYRSGEPELVIAQIDGEPRLAWLSEEYTFPLFHYLVYYDAQNGKELKRNRYKDVWD